MTLLLSSRARRAVGVAGWLLLTYTALFWRLGQASLWDPDEGHYAVTTRALLENRDWLVPTFNGQPFFDKPVLFHDLQAISMWLFGANELAVRAVTAGAALALLGVVYWLARECVNQSVATGATVLFTTSPALAALARYAILDAVFALFLFGSVATLAIAALRERWRLQWVGYSLLALAVLTKGPVALALAGLTFVMCILVSTSVRRNLLRLQWISGVLLVIGLSSPWFIYMYARFGWDFVQGYLLNENLLLFSRPPYANQPAWWFYLGVISGMMLPWTPALVGRLIDHARGHSTAQVDDFEVMLWCWVSAVIVFFSASQFKLDHYVFPAAPALYLLTARAWFDVTSPSSNPLPMTTLGLRAIGPIVLIVGIALGVLLTRVDLPLWAWILPTGWIVLGLWLLPLRPTCLDRIPAMTAMAFALFYVVAVGAVIPRFEQQKVVDDLARWMTEHAPPSSKFCSFRLNRWNNSLLFYLHRPVTITDDVTHFSKFASAEPSFMCLMTAAERQRLLQSGLDVPEVYRREGLWATSGVALQRSRGALTAFVVVGRP